MNKNTCQAVDNYRYTLSSIKRNVSMYANTNPLDFFAKHGMMSDPGKHASLFSDLPDDIPTLCKVVQGLLIHEGWAEHYIFRTCAYVYLPL
jgi:hypothetical protein